jgi:hypothetical protein
MLAFLPDKIVCCLKKQGEILAVNIIKEVYEFITKSFETSYSLPKPINIEALMDEEDIKVAENDTVTDTKKEPYKRSLRNWCWHGFEHIKTFISIRTNEFIEVELMLPYDIDLCYDPILKLFNETELFNSSFFTDLKESDLKNTEENLFYFEPFGDIPEKGEVHIGEQMPYKENMMRQIEKEIMSAVGEKHQVWIYHHFKNTSYSRERGCKDLEFIFNDFGFYVSFTTEMKGERYWEQFKKFSKDKRTIFSGIKEQLAKQLGIEGDKIEGENLGKFNDAFLTRIMNDRNFPGFTPPSRKDKGEISPGKVFKFGEIFEQALKEVFEVYWENRTIRFFQSSEVGVASITRFTRLPEFLIDLAEEVEDPRNESYKEKLNSVDEKEKKHYNVLSETEKFLFIPQVNSEYTVFPVIMNNVYWGVILIFWFKPEKTDKIERYNKLYEGHREISKQLKRNLLNYTERGILSEFENYTRDRILKVRDEKDFAREMGEIEHEARRNPVIPDITTFCLEEHCKCPITKGHYVILNPESETDREKFEKFSECLELEKKEDSNYRDWKYVILFPARKLPPTNNDKKICTIFSGSRPFDYYSPTIRLNCMAIDDYINTAWELVLLEKEKKKLYIRDAAVAIMLDTFSHNIAAHSMRHLLNLLHEREQKHLEIWENIYFDYSNENTEIEKILGVKDSREWAEQPIGIQRYISFLREKSTFWNGLISEIYTSWGTMLNLYEVMKKLVGNYLYIGSIASDLGINGVEFHIGIDDNKPIKWGSSTIAEYEYPLKKANEFSKVKKEWKHSSSPEDELELVKRELYFPGGLIGLHAFYTIIENTIRNAKFVDIKEKIIPLLILIREDGNFFEIRVGIDYKSKDVRKIENIKTLLEQPIIDKDNRTQKGGVPQSKISAAVLRGYPLIDSNEPLKNFKPKTLIGVDSTFEKEMKVFWRFFVWKASTYQLFSKEFLDNIKESQDNPFRFKFLIVPPDQREKFNSIEPDKFPIRVVHIHRPEQDYSEDELYRFWLKEWTGGKPIKLIYKHSPEDPHQGEEVIWDGEYIRPPESGIANSILTFSFYHSGDNTEEYFTYLKKHLIGTRSNRIFDDQFLEGQKLNPQNIPCLIETVYTGITIVDNEMYRLWDKIVRQFGRTPGEVQPYVSQTLRLNIFSEVDSKAKLLEMMKGNQGQHICIVHLSMIDDLYGKNEENRNQYMEEALQHFQYVILTTGRGREDAYASLKKEYKTRTRFIYRNQFEKAFERALEVPGEEFFIVKFFLVKILLGG